MTQKEIEETADEFWKEVEKEAEKLEVTVDYYMLEFFCSWHDCLTSNNIYTKIKE